VAIEEGGGANPLLEILDLVVLRGDRLVIGRREPGGVVHGLNLVLRQGEAALLEAPNGWGKTTLLEALMGIVPIAQGTIRFAGQPIQGFSPWQRARLGMVLLQSQKHSFPSLTVAESLRLAEVDLVPDEMLLLRNRHLSELSGGEKQKVAIRCATRKHRLGLYDEPFSALDPKGILSLCDEVKRSNRNRASLFALPSVLQIENV
jgi:urea transport system ATP-binding protein